MATMLQWEKSMGGCNLLKLQSGNVGGEAGDDAGHIPRPVDISSCSESTTIGFAIVLSKPTPRVRS